MKQFDIFLKPPQLKDPDESREMAAFCSKIQGILRNIVENLNSVKIVTSAPSASELEEILDRSDVVILHDSTQSNRCVYYKYQGTVYKIQSA